QGHADAMYRLGLYHAEGFGLNPDYDPNEAAKWFRKAARLGVEEANEELAELRPYLDEDEDEDAPPTEDETVRKLRTAAASGDVEAARDLAYRLQHGDGVEKDLVEAARLFRQAAEQGDAQAAYALGFAYQLGFGVDKSPSQVFYWYREAAAFGDVDATANVAACYENGFGVERDPVEAARWLRKAAELGDFEARRRLEELD
ncbi:MAG: sel1 repeat family protein, partial [Thermoguttaceae bacterium]|nr:sel1 repeat family protein [Thermoguttaceae bacterium]